MAKSKKPAKPSFMASYKAMRKEPTPPGRVIQPRDREIADALDQDEARQWETWRGEDLEDFEG